MIRKLFTAVLLLCNTALIAQAPKQYSGDQLREDLLFVARTLESTHPDVYHSTPKAAFERLRDSLAQEAGKGGTQEDAWRLIARLCAAVNEGHTDASYPSEVFERFNAGAIGVFPVLTSALDHDGFNVRWYLGVDSALQVGDHITSINGVGGAALHERLTQWFGGLEPWRRLRSQRDPGTLFHLAGFQPPYTVQYTRDGASHTVVLREVYAPQVKTSIEEYRRCYPRGAETRYALEWQGEVALIRFNSMGGPFDAFRRFLDSAFTDINARGAKGVIVDLRRNGGGNSGQGQLLLSYLTDKRFRMGGGSRWKVSPEFRAFYASMDATRRADYGKPWERYLAMTDGEILSATARKPQRPDNNPLRYKGPVCFLIGPGTFSSANMLANAVGDFQLAPLIGEPTGEAPNDYGEILNFGTPNTKIHFITSSTQWVRANGDQNDHNPVLPDILVRPDPTGKTDKPLETAVQWVLKGGK